MKPNTVRQQELDFRALPSKEEYERAMQVVQQGTMFVLQKKNEVTGQWLSEVKNIRGKVRGCELLNEVKERFPDREWRLVAKYEADKYQEGWNAHLAWATR